MRFQKRGLIIIKVNVFVGSMTIIRKNVTTRLSDIYLLTS